MVSESVTYAGYLAMAILPAPESPLPRMGCYNEAVLAAFARRALRREHRHHQLRHLGHCAWPWSSSSSPWSCAPAARRPPPTPAAPVGLGLIAYLTVVVVLFFVPWGLNYLFADLVTAQVRAWNRLLPFLLLLFVLGAAAALPARGSRRPGRTRCPSPSSSSGSRRSTRSTPTARPTPAASPRQRRRPTPARDYAIAANAAIPADCGVLQLPHMVYPENGPSIGVNDYDHFLPRHERRQGVELRGREEHRRRGVGGAAAAGADDRAGGAGCARRASARSTSTPAASPTRSCPP